MAQTKISDTQLDQIEKDLTKAKDEEIAAIESEIASLQASLSDLEGDDLAAVQASIAALQSKITQVNADFDACIQTLERIRQECAKAEGASQSVLQGLFLDLKEQNTQMVSNHAGGATTTSQTASDVTKNMYEKSNFNLETLKKNFPELYTAVTMGGKSLEWAEIAFMQKTGVPASVIEQAMNKYGLTSDSAYMDFDTYKAAQEAGMSYQDYVKRQKELMAQWGKTVKTGDDCMQELKEFMEKYGVVPGSESDFLRNKSFMDRSSITLEGTDSYKVSIEMAEVDPETGICFVDGSEVGLDGEKLYTVAVGDMLASATSGTARGGDVIKVTWEDGTSDYLVVGDTKGGFYFGHDNKVSDENNQSWDVGGYANAIELICGGKGSGAVRNSMGYHGIYRDDLSLEGDTLNHWNQSIASFEITGLNVLGY